MNTKINMKIGLSILVLLIIPMNTSAMTFNVDGVNINVNEWDIDVDWKNTDVIISISTTITNTLYRDATIEYSGEKVLVLARSTCETLTIVTVDMFGRNTDIKWERTSPIKMLDSTKHTGEQEITVSRTDTQQQFEKIWCPEPSEEVYTEGEECVTPTPDPCDDITCESKCYGVDLYETVCINGVCIQQDLLEINSVQCGYVTPDPCEGVNCGLKCYGIDLYDTTCYEGTCYKSSLIERNSVECGFVVPVTQPTPEATPEATPYPTPEATPEEPAIGETMVPIITIEPPIYSGVVRNNGEILDIRVIPDPLIAGGDVRIEVDILNTGTVRTCYEIYWDSRWNEIWIYAGDMATYTFTGSMRDPGEKTWNFKLEWDATWPTLNVLLQTATVNVRCYTQYEVDNL